MYEKDPDMSSAPFVSLNGDSPMPTSPKSSSSSPSRCSLRERRICGSRSAFYAVTASVLAVLAVAAGLLTHYFFFRKPAHAPLGYGRVPPPFYLYPPPTSTFPSSPLYAVTVQFLFASNGTPATPAPLPSHVYYNSIAHRAQYPGASNARQDQSVSWTGFAFDASHYRARVTVTTTFAIRSCTLRPLSYGLSCAAPVNGTVATIDIPVSPLKISVELESPLVGNDPPGPTGFVAQPLFLFPDPPEDPATIPPANGPGVTYFPRGVHNLSEGQVVLGCGQNNVYLEPGAYVNGGFRTSCNGGVFVGPEAVVFSGRGVLSGETFPWHDARFLYGLLNIDQGKGNVVDGLTLIDSPEFYLRSYAASPTVRNVKMLASWPYNSDGVDVGAGGLIEDVFIRANDDSIKLPGGSGSLVLRVVIWQMLNGAAFQMGWNSKISAEGVSVRDVDIIHVDYCHMKTPGACSVSSGSNNNGIVVLSPPTAASPTVSISDVGLTRIRVEADVGRFLFVQATAGMSGSVSGFTLTGVSMAADSAPGGAVNVLGGPSPSAVSFDGWTFANVTVGGRCWASAAGAGMTVQGGVTNLNFLC